MSNATAREEAATARARADGDALLVAVAGAWSIEHPHPRAGDVLRAAPSGVRRVMFDTQALADWDSSLLVFLTQTQAYADEHQLEVDVSGLPEQVPRLLALSRAVPERVQPSRVRRHTSIVHLGLAVLGAWESTMDAVTFVGTVAVSGAGLLTRRVHMRWRDFWVIAQMNSSAALPIVTLIALLIGIIIAFLGVVVLQRFGAGYYVSYLVGVGVLREMGALMTGIILAGRTSAAFAAELGSMKITEEIDALVTLGISPVDHLVLPRLLGIFVMMPLLTIYADLIGIVGGLMVSVVMLDLSVVQFLIGLRDAVGLADALLGVGKGVVFGAIIGLAGCMRGLQTGSDASAVGKSTTSAVVLGITFIILANAVIDWLAALLNI